MGRGKGWGTGPNRTRHNIAECEGSEAILTQNLSVATAGVCRQHDSVRHWDGETISTAFVGSTVNRLTSERFVKLKPTRWTKAGGRLAVAGSRPGA